MRKLLLFINQTLAANTFDKVAITMLKIKFFWSRTIVLPSKFQCSKRFAPLVGLFVAGTKKFIDKLKAFSKSYIYSTAITEGGIIFFK